MHFLSAAHQLAWTQYPAVWLCECCAILWLVLRSFRSPWARAGVLLMICGLAMNAMVTDANAGTMPVVGMPPTLRPVSPMWHAATTHTRFSLLADQASLGLFSVGDVVLLFGGALIIAICIRRTVQRTAQLYARERARLTCSASASCRLCPEGIPPSAYLPGWMPEVPRRADRDVKMSAII